MKYLIFFFFGSILGSYLMSLYKDNFYKEELNKLNKQISYYAEINEKIKYKYKTSNIKRNIEYIERKEENIITFDDLSQFDKFKYYLNNNKFDAALEIYSRVLADNDKINYTKLLRNLIFKKYEESYSLGRLFAQKAKYIDPDEYYFLYIEMVADSRTGKYKEVLKNILELNKMYITSQSIAESIETYYSSNLIKLYNETIQSKNIQEILSIMNFFDEIQEYDYSKKLKDRIYSINKKNEKELEEYVENLQKDRDKWKKEEEKRRLSRLYNLKIPLKKLGKHYFITVRVNNGREIDLIFDTGASFVSIKSDILKQYNPRLMKSDVEFNTANGKVKKNGYLVNQFNVGDIKFKDYPIYELNNYESSTADGLFGMDFLDKFKWEIDDDNNILFLNRK